MININFEITWWMWASLGIIVGVVGIWLLGKLADAILPGD